MCVGLFLLVVTDKMGRHEGMKQVWVVFETCKAILVRLYLFCCAKGVVREKLAKCDRGLILLGSDMQLDIRLDIRARDDHLSPLTSNHVS